MRRLVLALFVVAGAGLTHPVAAQQPMTSTVSPAAAVTTARTVWMIPRGFVLRALEQVPDSLLAYRPTPDVRSLGQLFAHVADGEHLFCSLALGEAAPNPFDVNEKTKKTKAEIQQALQESLAHCEKAYAQSDAAAQTPADFFGQKQNRLFLLNMNGAHDYEHYGNIVTYLRLNKLTPPSSQR
jgi:uncharacterized damage-inducible protein DinB